MKTLYLNPSDDIQDAVNRLEEPALVYLEKGIYRAKTEITADNITIIGQGKDTVITNGDYARKIHADGLEYNTFRTYTLCITGDNVTLKNLTVVNSNTAPQDVGQCVALSVHGNMFRADGVNLVSTQDTLFLSPFPDDLTVRYADFLPKRQLYREGSSLHVFTNCRIAGNVDFIFGCSEAYFEKCEIVSVNDARGTGFVSAPAHPLAEAHGFTFIDCSFEDNGAGENTVYLARPWRDFGKSVFINCSLGRHVRSELFDKWNDTDRDRTARFCHYGLKGIDVKPVAWAKALDTGEAENIIARYRQCLNAFKG